MQRYWCPRWFIRLNINALQMALKSGGRFFGGEQLPSGCTLCTQCSGRNRSSWRSLFLFPFPFAWRIKVTFMKACVWAGSYSHCPAHRRAGNAAVGIYRQRPARESRQLKVCLCWRGQRSAGPDVKGFKYGSCVQGGLCVVDFTVSAHIHSHLLGKVKAAFISSDQKTRVIHAERGFNKQTKEKQEGCVLTASK